MKLLKLKYKNLQSFEKVEFDFRGKDLLLLIGDNGSGKSSFFDLIAWVLYGQVPRKKHSVLRDVPAKQSKGIGSIAFKDKSRVLAVKRAINARGEQDVRLFAGKTEVTSRTRTQTQEQIDNIIGLSYASFINVVYFAQNDIGRFLNSSSGDRISILGDILDIQIYDKVRKLVSVDLKSKSSEVSEFKGRVDAYREQITAIDIELLIPERKKLQKRIRKYSNKLTELEEQVRQFNKLTSERKSLEEMKANLVTEIEFIDDIIQNIQESIEEGKERFDGRSPKRVINSIDSKIKRAKGFLAEFEEIEEQEAGAKRMLTDVLEKIEKKSNTIAKYRNKIKEQNSIISLGKECPTCLQTVTEAHRETIKGRAKTYKGKIKKRHTELAPLFARRDELETEIADISELKGDYRVKIQELSNLRDERKHLVGYAKRLLADKESLKRKEAERKQTEGARKKAIKKQTERVRELEDSLSSYKLKEAMKESEETEQRLEKSERRLAGIDTEVKRYNSLKKSLHKLEKRHEQIEVEYRMAEWWNNALPVMKMRLISETIPYLEHLTNSYLGSIIPWMRLAYIIDPTRKSNKLDIIISDISNKVERNFESWSGAERNIISIAVYMALNEIVRKRSGKNIGFIILDEKFGFLDGKYRDALLELLKEQSHDRSIYAISHISEIKDTFSQVYKVVKRNGVSKVIENGE